MDVFSTYKNKPWDEIMTEEQTKASAALPAAYISADILANNGQDGADLSDTWEDSSDSVSLYTDKEEVQNTVVSSMLKCLGY